MIFRLAQKQKQPPWADAFSATSQPSPAHVAAGTFPLPPFMLCNVVVALALSIPALIVDGASATAAVGGGEGNAE